MEARRRPFSLAFVWLGCGVVLFAVGAKLALIDRYGTDQPYADQWAAEGAHLVRGMLYYPLSFSQVISPHGEHRPGLTRLWVRGLILANKGQWDCFVELVADLLIYGAFLTLAWRRLCPLVDGFWRMGLAILMALLFALPCAYENFLWGFQSQFLLLFPLGLWHVGGTLTATPPGWRWAGAQVAGLLGLFSIAAGVMSAAALVGIALLEIFRKRRDAWVWATLITNLFLFGLGIWLLPPAAARSESWISLLTATVHSAACLLSWPRAGVWWCVLFQAPWVATLLIWLFGKKSDQGDRLVAALGGWICLAAGAIAYGRGVTSDNIGNRYYDVLLFGVFANGFALLRFVAQRSGWIRGLGILLTVAWLMPMSTALWVRNNPSDLQQLFTYQKNLAHEQTQILRDFMVSKNPAALQEFAQRTGRFPHMAITLEFLTDEKVYPFLPPSLATGGKVGPLSRLSTRISTWWSVLLGTGIVLLVAGTLVTGVESRQRKEQKNTAPT